MWALKLQIAVIIITISDNGATKKRSTFKFKVNKNHSHLMNFRHQQELSNGIRQHKMTCGSVYHYINTFGATLHNRPRLLTNFVNVISALLSSGCERACITVTHLIDVYKWSATAIDEIKWNGISMQICSILSRSIRRFLSVGRGASSIDIFFLLL